MFSESVLRIFRLSRISVPQLPQVSFSDRAQGCPFFTLHFYFRLLLTKFWDIFKRIISKGLRGYELTKR